MIQKNLLISPLDLVNIIRELHEFGEAKDIDTEDKETILQLLYDHYRAHAEVSAIYGLLAEVCATKMSKRPKIHIPSVPNDNEE